MSDNYTLRTRTRTSEGADEKETLSSDEQTQNNTVNSARDGPKSKKASKTSDYLGEREKE